MSRWSVRVWPKSIAGFPAASLVPRMERADAKARRNGIVMWIQRQTARSAWALCLTHPEHQLPEMEAGRHALVRGRGLGQGPDAVDRRHPAPLLDDLE